MGIEALEVPRGKRLDRVTVAGIKEAVAVAMAMAVDGAEEPEVAETRDAKRECRASQA